MFRLLLECHASVAEGITLFQGIYNPERLRYIHRNFLRSKLCSDFTPGEIIAKTACFFSENLDVYIDTSDGVNDDLGIQEYAGRMLSCIKVSNGKRFLYLKCAHSPLWSKDITELAEKNNGTVEPFFKFSFNKNFYKFLYPNIKDLRKKNMETVPDFDLGIFADLKKVYSYPKPSISDPRVSWSDHKKFNISGASHDTGMLVVNSRSFVLEKLQDTNFKMLIEHADYADYISSSIKCKAVINPPGIGEYTSRMMDQTAIGNLIILRKNSYDQAASWKEFIPEVDFSSENYKDELQDILENCALWQEKSRYYYDTFWTPDAVFNHLATRVKEVL